MKKRLPKKLRLASETLRHLAPEKLRRVGGEADQQCGSINSSGGGYTEEFSYCFPCTSDYTLLQAYC
jgi:hypothetical protein